MFSPYPSNTVTENWVFFMCERNCLCRFSPYISRIASQDFFVMVIGIPQHNEANKLSFDWELMHEQQSYRTFEFSFLK